MRGLLQGKPQVHYQAAYGAKAGIAFSIGRYVGDHLGERERERDRYIYVYIYIYITHTHRGDRSNQQLAGIAFAWLSSFHLCILPA